MTYGFYYVYTLAYPDGRIFYVGKGQGDRILQHEKEARLYAQYGSSQQQESAKIQVIREIWASGGQVIKAKVFETASEEEAYEYEKHYIAQCDPRFLTNRTKGGGPQFSKRDPYARIKYREYYYSPKEAGEKLGISQEVWHRLFLSGVLHFYRVEGCTFPVLDRKEIDEFATKIKDGTYPIDAWEMDAPNVWAGRRIKKKSSWLDDDYSPEQEEHPIMSRLEMQQEATTLALNTAQRATSEPCHVIGSYERNQSEPDERIWDVTIKVGEENYTYTIQLHQNQFTVCGFPAYLPIQPEKQSVTDTELRNDESYDDMVSIEQVHDDYRQPIIPAISLHSTESIPSPVEPTLSKAQVEAKWVLVLQRIKRQKDGAIIVALLKGYSIVDVKDTEGVPVIMLKAIAPFHYEAVKKKGYAPTIEWALLMELKHTCRLSLLPPGPSSP